MPTMVALSSVPSYSPSSNWMRDMVLMQGSSREVHKRLLQVQTDALQYQSTLLDLLNRELSQKSKETLDKKGNLATWENVSYYSSIASIVGGTALMCTGVSIPAGVLLTTCGIINLVVASTTAETWQSLAEHLSDDEETQKKLAFGMQMSAVLLSTAAAVAGTYYGCPNGSMNTVKSIFQCFSAGASTTLGVVRTGLEYSTLTSEAQLSSLQGASKIHEMTLSDMGSNTESSAKAQQQITDLMARCLDDYAQALQSLNHKN